MCQGEEMKDVVGREGDTVVMILVHTNSWWFLLEIYQPVGLDGLAVEESSSNPSY